MFSVVPGMLNSVNGVFGRNLSRKSGAEHVHVLEFPSENPCHSSMLPSMKAHVSLDSWLPPLSGKHHSSD